ncbi:MAG: ribosome small subunit-dependent GTPase A, partial [Methylophilaceae bacterium]|nr:ribosome small subunit-dependent GTPase A [Methylophilaceae bacterium]
WRGWFYSTDHVDIALNHIHLASLDTLDPQINLAKDRVDFENEPLILHDERNETAKIQTLIVLNKCDLAETNDAKSKLKVYENLGYQIVHLSAKEDVSPLLPYLNHHQSVLVGQSGMGKSTIINALLPNENVRTQEISNTLDSGKHTTTAAHLYHLDADSALIDSPGLQEFGLNHLSHEDLELAFIEFRPFLGNCRFSDCKHQHEPDCAVMHAVKTGKINAVRLAFYQALSTELSNTP